MVKNAVKSSITPLAAYIDALEVHSNYELLKELIAQAISQLTHLETWSTSLSNALPAVNNQSKMIVELGEHVDYLVAKISLMRKWQKTVLTRWTKSNRMIYDLAKS